MDFHFHFSDQSPGFGVPVGVSFNMWYTSNLNR